MVNRADSAVAVLITFENVIISDLPQGVPTNDALLP
jgi:hypothetical protein